MSVVFWPALAVLAALAALLLVLVATNLLIGYAETSGVGRKFGAFLERVYRFGRRLGGGS